MEKPGKDSLAFLFDDHLFRSARLSAKVLRNSPESNTLTAAGEYGYELGLAFQIRDDMLDVIGTDEFGKPIGSDREEGKVTYVDLLGLEGCDRAVLDCTERAKAAVRACDTDGFLAALADSLAERNK